MTVAVFGSINIDLNLSVERHPLPGETLLGGGGALSPGGKGANQALACAYNGAKTIMVGQVGKDQNADSALTLLRKLGVCVQHVRAVPGPTGLAVVTVAADGENTVLVVSGANIAYDSEDIEWVNDAVAPAEIIVMQGEVPAACMEKVAIRAQERSQRVLLNLAPAIDVSPELLRAANPLVVNEHEALRAAEILGGTKSQDGDLFTEANWAIEYLLAAGVESVVITLGAEGCLIGYRGEDTADRKITIDHVPAVKTQAVDTVGAGDAFVGAIAAALERGETLHRGAQIATRFASASVRFPGAAASYEAAAAYLEGKE